MLGRKIAERTRRIGEGTETNKKIVSFLAHSVRSRSHNRRQNIRLQKG